MLEQYSIQNKQSIIFHVCYLLFCSYRYGHNVHNKQTRFHPIYTIPCFPFVKLLISIHSDSDSDSDSDSEILLFTPYNT